MSLEREFTCDNKKRRKRVTGLWTGPLIHRGDEAVAEKDERRSGVMVNRAPVLTLWAAVMAEVLGFEHTEALTLGRAVAGLSAYSKGVSLGFFQPTPKEVQEQRRKMRKEKAVTVDLLHRAVPAKNTDEGLRALSGESPIRPESVQKYLEGKFGDTVAG
jgi:hypothetical protein